MKKQKHAARTKKPSKLDQITTSTIQAFAHLSSADATKRNIVLSCEASTVDSDIAELSARLARTRARRAEIEAQIAGLCAVIRARG
jgi:hypothetical protein